MDKEDIIRMAREAEFGGFVNMITNPLERFAALVAEHALRERLAQPEQEHTGFMDSKINPIWRQWVGLTDDDEIPWDGIDAKSFAKAIEAKLKEKNK